MVGRCGNDKNMACSFREKCRMCVKAMESASILALGDVIEGRGGQKNRFGTRWKWHIGWRDIWVSVGGLVGVVAMSTERIYGNSASRQHRLGELAAREGGNGSVWVWWGGDSSKRSRMTGKEEEGVWHNLWGLRVRITWGEEAAVVREMETKVWFAASTGLHTQCAVRWTIKMV